MEKTEFMKFNESQSFDYFTVPSAPSPTSKDIRWAPPLDTTIYFVWDNPDSHTSKTVSALFLVEHNKTLLPPIALVFGLLLLFGGLATIGYGFHPPTLSSSRSEIIIGYVFAVLGEFLAIFIGGDLIRKENSEDKFHGKLILAIGLFATIIYLLLALI